jgi:hypothetical protein
MAAVRYPSEEWLEESAKVYRASPKIQEDLRKVTTRIFYRIKADAAWGIEQDLLFGAIVEKGVLHELRFFGEAEAKATAEFIMSATPQEWKKILRKENKFLTDFMLGKITLEQGSKTGVIGLAPYAPTFIDALTQVEVRFADDLAPQELEQLRGELRAMRARLGG